VTAHGFTMLTNPRISMYNPLSTQTEYSKVRSLLLF